MPVVEWSDDEKRESDGEEKGEADERVEEGEAGAGGRLFRVRGIWLRRVELMLRRR
jgi:hypothetical protein